MTDSKPLYTQDSYIQAFEATIIRTGPRFVVLDQTAFYPEGGGQPSDTGTLETTDKTYNVIKAMKRGSQIFHYLDGNIETMTRVKGTIDWSRRYRYMQLHSGEHLLTGLLEARGSGPKVFSSFTQLDFKPSEIDESIVLEVWKRFDEIIDEDVPVRIYYTNREELEIGDDQRKKSFLEKIPKNVLELRMIEIGDYALTFCMGTHVKNTGDIPKIKNLSIESKKKRRKVVYFDLK